MDSPVLFSLLFLSSLFLGPAQSAAHPACPVDYRCCPTGPPVRFPFQIRGLYRDRCGYPGFDLFCDSLNRTILKLGSSGAFAVSSIDYVAQNIWINDPDDCLPSRLLRFSLIGTRFEPVNPMYFNFLNCSANASIPPRQIVPVPCVGDGDGFTVVATPFQFVADILVADALCGKVAQVLLPGRLPFYEYAVGDLPGLGDDLLLTWDNPNCGICEEQGGICGFQDGEGFRIECSNVPDHGLSRSTKYGLIMGLGIPGLIGIIGFACHICNRIRAQGRRRNLDMGLSPFSFSSVAPQTVVVARGLDRSTIESFPKTLLGQSRRLPNPNDSTCTICLSEYRPREIVRSIPECNHYFHSNCIEEWLSKNATCPLCRISIEGASSVTPNTSN
ncbi:putative RING-H2 finger protein ATL21B [Malania oleifera]|uniref:putative RING-H2 finger protein ATL21B n=1 Tax=Malania oleifera TaxID=397392 RepID=UPI0025AE1965|nr:putative RING-H2 finger protein ATL21B [Malania oleifera]